MKSGWYPWVNRDGDQLGVLHYFEVGFGNPDNDDDEMVYRPLCGTGYPQAPNAWAVDDTPPFRYNTRCKRCQKTAPHFEEVVIRVPGDGSEHLDYISRNYEHIPDFLWNSIGLVMDMAERWIKLQNEHEQALEAYRAKERAQ